MAVLLVALWLPATQHCVLEVVGALEVTCIDHGAMDESREDSCGAIENGGYKPAGATLKVPAPGLFACACFLCLDRELRTPAAAPFLTGADAMARSDAWIPTWQFVRRAAPLPGAPSFPSA